MIETAELLELSDSRWQEALAELSHDVYHLPEYVAVEAQRLHGRGMAFLGTTSGFRLFVPFVLVEIPNASGRDALAPYGYPGPLASDVMPAGDLRAASVATYAEMLRLLRERHAVTLFLRLHPLLSRPDLLPPAQGHLARHGQTVSIDLSLPEQDQWSQVRSNHRRQIRRARTVGLQTEIDLVGKQLGEFERLYLETMRRVGAEEHYFFPADYFTTLWERLGGEHLFVAAVRHEGRVACAGLFSRSENIIQYLFGGTRTDALRLQPSKVMFDEVRRWGTVHGFQELHLGGGLGGRADDLFHFKAGFSKRRFAFHTWRYVIDEDAYRRLLGLGPLEAVPLDGFFPAYRSPSAQAVPDADRVSALSANSSRSRPTITTS